MLTRREKNAEATGFPLPAAGAGGIAGPAPASFRRTPAEPRRAGVPRAERHLPRASWVRPHERASMNKSFRRVAAAACLPALLFLSYFISAKEMKVVRSDRATEGKSADASPFAGNASCS